MAGFFGGGSCPGSKLVKEACSDMLIQTDWGLNLEVLDYAGGGSKNAGEVGARLTKELDSSNPKVVTLALHLMETLVKNGSFTVHAALSGELEPLPSPHSAAS